MSFVCDFLANIAFIASSYVVFILLADDGNTSLLRPRPVSRAWIRYDWETEAAYQHQPAWPSGKALGW